MRSVIGTIGAFEPKVPRIPVERSCVIDPSTGPVAANLNERKIEGSTVRTSARLIGIETGPMERNGCPNARTALPSTHVTVPVADRSMSPERSCAAIADPGFSAGSAAVAVPLEELEAPEGVDTQRALWMNLS